MQETWVRSLGWEDLLEEEMAAHYSILAWKIPWTEEPGAQATVHGVTSLPVQIPEQAFHLSFENIATWTLVLQWSLPGLRAACSN